MTGSMTVKNIERSMRAAILLDMIMTPADEQWLRVMNMGRGEDGLLWFIYDNGCGDRMWVYLMGEKAVIKGFDHENELSPYAAEEWDKTLYEQWFEGMPRDLYGLFTEEEREETTFCLWTVDGGMTWQDNAIPEDDGGREWLTGLIFPDADCLRDWADSYYDAKLPAEIIRRLFENCGLSAEEMRMLRPECDTEGVLEEYGSSGRGGCFG